MNLRRRSQKMTVERHCKNKGKSRKARLVSRSVHMVSASLFAKRRLQCTYGFTEGYSQRGRCDCEGV